MPKIIDLEVLDNFKTRQDEQNDGHFIRRSDVTKSGDDVKVNIDPTDPAMDLKLLTPESIFGDVANRIISLEHIPAAAREYVVTVNSEAAKLALTKNDIQNGDVVHVIDTTNNIDKMYYVVDDTKLGTENAFQVFKAGIASEVAWANVTGKPASKGSSTQPVYINASGEPTACTYTIGKSVPSDAKFTDTTYSAATQSAAGLMSAADKKKLDGVATNANNYSHPTSSGNKHIPSGGSSGQILRWSADGTATWGSDNNTTYSNATQSAAGLMSASDKTKLDGIATGANNYSHPTGSGNRHMPANGSSGQYLVNNGTAGDATWTSAIIVQTSTPSNPINGQMWIEP